MQLARVNRGQEGSLTDHRCRRSEPLTAGLHLIPKLVVQVRLPSPTPREEGPSRGMMPVPAVGCLRHQTAAPLTSHAVTPTLRLRRGLRLRDDRWLQGVPSRVEAEVWSSHPPSPQDEPSRPGCGGEGHFSR